MLSKGVPRVLGVDSSLTGTGFAVVELGSAGWSTAMWTAGRKGSRSESLAQRSRRVASIVDSIEDAGISTLSAAGIEAPAHGARGGSVWDRAHLWWEIVERLLSSGVPVVLVNSSTRQKFAVGHSHSVQRPVDKSDVAMAAARMWPEAEIVGNNAADALVIASVVASRMGLDVPFPLHGYRRDALAAVAVPRVAVAR